MDFLGIGPFELLLILVLAFLFFGPEKLPGMAAKAGRLYRKLKKASTDFSKSFTDELSAYDKGTSNDLKEDSRHLRQDLSDLRRSIVDDINSGGPSDKKQTEQAQPTDSHTEPQDPADYPGQNPNLKKEKDNHERG